MKILRYLKVQAFLFALLPGMVFSLGLGDLKLESALNEKFSARIQLLLTDAEEVDDSLIFRLADSEAFKRAGIERPFILSRLQFELRRAKGSHYVYIYSEEPMREPFLNFLIEASWSKGRLFREYTVLLDPLPHAPQSSTQLVAGAPIMITAPTIDDASTVDATALTIADGVAPAGAVVKKDVGEVDSVTPPAMTIVDDVGHRDDIGHKVIYSKDFERYTASSGGDYGPTRESDTLWSIAKAVRPDDNISIQQMMLALLHANKDAFLHQNINGLKRGHILRVPSISELGSLSYAEALAAVNLQHASWEEVKQGIIGDATSERPALSSDAGTVTSDVEVAGTTVGAELRLVSPSEEKEAAGTAQVSGEQAAGKKALTTDIAAKDLVLVQESMEALTQENADLRNQLQETEALIEDLKRLIELKDDKLAVLQAQLIEKQATSGKLEAGDTATETAVEVGTTIEEQADVSAVEERLDMTAAEESVGGADPGVGSIIADNIFIILIIIGGIILVSLSILVVIRRLERRASVDKEKDLAVAKEALDLEEEPLISEEEESEESLFEASIPSDLSEDKTARDRHASVEEGPEKREESLQEVNTYLAFEQFDQAEECVRDAIKQEPDNLDYYIKLLEVFYTAGNKKSYEEVAKTLSERVDEDSEYWGMAVAMWSEMSPSRALFEKGAEKEEKSADSGSGGIVDITTDTEATEEKIDFDLSGAAAEEPLLDVSDNQSTGIDKDIDNALDITSDTRLELSADEGVVPIDEQGSGLALEGVAPDIEKDEDDDIPTIDFSPDEVGIDLEAAKDDDEKGPGAEQKVDDGNVLDFDLGLDREIVRKASQQTLAAEDEEDEMEKTAAIPLSSLPQEQDLEDEIATKLDLARAYIELGDKEHARSILDEVSSEGDEKQRKQAEELLARVDAAS